MTQGTIMIIGAIVVVLLIVVAVGLRRSGHASQRYNESDLTKEKKQEFSAQALKGSVKKQTDRWDLIPIAKQNGATHFENAGLVICFYRTHDGKVERCFAEYSPSTNNYEWVWPPSEWHADQVKIPESAKPIPDDF